MIVTARPVRGVDFNMFTDLTPVAVVADGIQWLGDGVLSVEFASDLTPAEVSAVQQRMESRNANEETLRNQAIVAMQGNRDFLNIPGTPTNAQVLAQVKALSRQSNGVIRMLLGQLDGTD
jgi:hypothetical protein